MARSRRVSGADRPKGYGSVDYSRSIGAGFKVLGVLVLLGAVLCLWLANPKPPSREKELKAATNGLLVGVYDALTNLKKPVTDDAEAFEKLCEIALCPQCEGGRTIINDEEEEVLCPTCKGIGISLQVGTPGLRFRQMLLKSAECPSCRGKGRINYALCKGCKGKGYAGGERSVEEILRNLSSGIIRDAFGGKIKIEVEAYGKKSEYTIISAGPDKRFGTFDDLDYCGATATDE